MTREEALAELVRRGSKDEPNLYITMKRDASTRPSYPYVGTIIEFGDRRSLDAIKLALGGHVCTGYNGISATPNLVFEHEEAFNLLYPYDQLIWPLERTRTDNGKKRAWFGREVIRACLAQNKDYGKWLK